MSLMRKLVSSSVKKQVKLLAVRTLKGDVKFSSSASIVSGIISSGIPDMDIPRISLEEYVFENIGKWENHIAMVIKCIFFYNIIHKIFL